MASAWSGDRKSESKCTLSRTAPCRNDFRSRVPKCFRKWLWLTLFPISCSVHATFIKINICRRHLGGGQGRAPSKGNRYTRELRTPKKNITFHGRRQKEQWVLGRVVGGEGCVSFRASALSVSPLIHCLVLHWLPPLECMIPDGRATFYSFWIEIIYPEWHVYQVPTWC